MDYLTSWADLCAAHAAWVNYLQEERAVTTPKLPRPGTRARVIIDKVRTCPGITTLELTDFTHDHMDNVGGTLRTYARSGVVARCWTADRGEGWKLADGVTS